MLRYGQFYGPGTYNEQQPPEEPRVHIDRAAERTVERWTSRPASSSSSTERTACHFPQISAPAPPSPHPPRRLALAGGAITFTSLYLAAGALTPLLVLYREQWGFAASLLTLAFAVYAIGFLAALLTLGSLSDHVGRRPVLIGALIIQLASNLHVPDRARHRLGDRRPDRAGRSPPARRRPRSPRRSSRSPRPNRKRLGTILGSVGLTGGLALGSLLAGLAIQLTTAANTIVFVVLSVVTVARDRRRRAVARDRHPRTPERCAR